MIHVSLDLGKNSAAAAPCSRVLNLVGGRPPNARDLASVALVVMNPMQFEGHGGESEQIDRRRHPALAAGREGWAFDDGQHRFACGAVHDGRLLIDAHVPGLGEAALELDKNDVTGPASFASHVGHTGTTFGGGDGLHRRWLQAMNIS
jgi:hypothetical protein